MIASAEAGSKPPAAERPVGDSWRVEETYLKVRGRWVYFTAPNPLADRPLHLEVD
jgi:transposase-like protein